MAILDAIPAPERLLEPPADDPPCGPDLDAAYDLDFTQAVAGAEGVLPASFFARDEEGHLVPFDRTSIDFAAAAGPLLDLLGRTRDLRLLALLGRFAALEGSLSGLAAALSGSAALLEARWDEVHPRGEDGDFALRGAALQSLDDMPTVVLPLQHIAVAESRRFGAVTLRAAMIAAGEVPPREGVPAPDRGAIERALDDADLEALTARRDALAGIVAAAAAIRAATTAKAGHEASVALPRLSAAAERLLALVDPVLRARTGAPPDAGAPASDPAVATGSAAPSPARAADRVASAGEAAAALAAVRRYLRRSEPSSPAEILIRQAHLLVGKPFIEVMRAMVPAYLDSAALMLGRGKSLRLPVERLADLPDDLPDDPPDELPDEPEEESRQGVEREDADEPAGGSRGALDGAGEAFPQDDRGGDRGDGRGDDGGGGGGAAAPPPPAPPPAPPAFAATTRAEAAQLIRAVGQFYRGAEPSSPIPLLLDKASGLLERDFLSILRDVLPDLMSRDDEA